ncbi:MAG TPA: hypothetical protein VIE64_07090 [Solirubrobacterales bacterium]|jgi:hypothetical protein
MFSGGFKRSSRFGLIGVIVVMILVAVIGLTMGSNDPNPKLALGLIFGVLAVFFVILFALQRSDLERVAGENVKGSERAVAEGGQAIENPMTMSEPELWTAMAIRPIDSEALKARSQMWDSGRRSQKLGMVVTLLIFLTVPPIYIFESFVPLLIGGPLIVLAAIYGSIRALAPGGDLDSGYDQVGTAMAPLGLEVTERPKVSIETRDAVTGRVGPKIHGALVLDGERHGHPVSVRLGGESKTGASEVTVRSGAPEFKAKARDGRVRPAEGAPTAIADVLASVPNSTRWKKVSVEGGPEGIVITRKGGEQSDWMADLWLAERLASGLTAGV